MTAPQAQEIRLKALLITALAIGAIAAAPAGATTVIDAEDLGQPGALDITEFTVERFGDEFEISVTTRGAISDTGSSYVIGVDRGGGQARPHPFAGIGRPDIVFDQAFSVRSNGDVFLGATKMFTFKIFDDPITHTGSFIGRLSGLESQGFTLDQFQFSLWSQSRALGLPVTNVDFAPENGTISAVPEPSTWALMLLGFGGMGSLVRRGRRQVRPVLAAA
jgi:hypothetical protein